MGVTGNQCNGRLAVSKSTHQLSTAKGQGDIGLVIAMWNLAPHLSDRQTRLVIGQLWVHWCWGQTPVCHEAALELRLECSSLLLCLRGLERGLVAPPTVIAATTSISKRQVALGLDFRFVNMAKNGRNCCR